jgi:hypothetical protein
MLAIPIAPTSSATAPSPTSRVVNRASALRWPSPFPLATSIPAGFEPAISVVKGHVRETWDYDRQQVPAKGTYLAGHDESALAPPWRYVPDVWAAIGPRAAITAEAPGCGWTTYSAMPATHIASATPATVPGPRSS